MSGESSDARLPAHIEVSEKIADIDIITIVEFLIVLNVDLTDCLC